MGKMKEYWQYALTVAKRLNRIEGIKTIPEIPVCNMFHVYFDTSKVTLERIFTNIIKKSDLAVVSNFREIDPPVARLSCLLEIANYTTESFR